jgi:hypothetical protein
MIQDRDQLISLCKKAILSLSLLGALLSAGCKAKEQPIIERAWEMDSLDHPAIALEDVKVVLPQAGNVELVELYCVSCHSLRYIEMQPPLSRKAWEKTVDKMINTFGAPVRDSVSRADIINYLYAIKGKQ